MVAASHSTIFIIRPFVFSATVRPESNNSAPRRPRTSSPRPSPLLFSSLSLLLSSSTSVRHLPFSDFHPPHLPPPVRSSIAGSILFRRFSSLPALVVVFLPGRERERTGTASVSPLIYCSQHGGSMRANQPTPPVPRVFPDDQPSRSFSPRGLSRFLGPGRRISPGQSTTFAIYIYTYIHVQFRALCARKFSKFPALKKV